MKALVLIQRQAKASNVKKAYALALLKKQLSGKQEVVG